ncbi:MAG TPA: class I SAM-dependent methyltransferase [Peptococcaceae bacterium]|nr:class I SAM-dependent methyltransferase [Peptococcaceae bacterium]
MLFNCHHPLTVAYKFSGQKQAGLIKYLSSTYGIKFISVESCQGSPLTYPLLRITKNGFCVEHNGQTLFFHPSMALLRMINIKRGIGDRFLEATALAEGDILLDATLGLGSDALIASWAVGEKGKIIALENSLLIFLLVKEGLERLTKQPLPKAKSKEKEEAWLELARASSRIDARYADHKDYLQTLPDSSVDVIYFDPMFRITVNSSSAIKPLKALSCPEPLSPETIKEACRVARKRIVLKERRHGSEFSRLGFKELEGSKYSSIGFGIIDLAT